MKTILMFFVLTILVSCTTAKKCQRLFPQVATRDSVYIQTLDTVKIILPGDTMKLETKVPCQDFELRTENSRLIQELRVVNGILKQKLTIKPDTVIEHVKNIVTKYKEVKVPQHIKYIPKFWKITGFIGISCIILLILYVILKVKKLWKI